MSLIVFCKLRTRACTYLLHIIILFTIYTFYLTVLGNTSSINSMMKDFRIKEFKYQDTKISTREITTVTKTPPKVEIFQTFCLTYIYSPACWTWNSLINGTSDRQLLYKICQSILGHEFPGILTNVIIHCNVHIHIRFHRLRST